MARGEAVLVANRPWVKHYRPTEDDPTVCGEYDPIDDESTWDREKVNCPKCQAIIQDRPWEEK